MVNHTTHPTDIHPTNSEMRDIERRPPTGHDAAAPRISGAWAGSMPDLDKVADRIAAANARIIYPV